MTFQSLESSPLQLFLTHLPFPVIPLHTRISPSSSDFFQISDSYWFPPWTRCFVSGKAVPSATGHYLCPSFTCLKFREWPKVTLVSDIVSQFFSAFHNCLFKFFSVLSFVRYVLKPFKKFLFQAKFKCHHFAKKEKVFIIIKHSQYGLKSWQCAYSAFV